VKKPDAVFVTSMMTYWYPGVFETIDTIRRVIPKVPVVLGGNYATLCCDHATKHSGADIVVKGDGESALPKVLKDLLMMICNSFRIKTISIHTPPSF